MHKKSFIIGLIGLFLFVAGGSIFYWVLTERRHQEREVNSLKAKYSTETEDYIRQYEQWMELPPEERTVLPWGLDENGNAKSIEMIHLEQQERLKSDLDKLASGEMIAYPFADDFYGEGWESQVEEYKNWKELNEFLFTSSILLTSAGGVISGWIIMLSISRFIVWILSSVLHFFKHLFKAQSDSNEQEQEEIVENQDNEQDGGENQSEEEYSGDISKVLVNSGWQYANSLRKSVKSKKANNSIRSETYLGADNSAFGKGLHSEPNPTEATISRALSQEKTIQPRQKLKSRAFSESPKPPKQDEPLDNTLKDLTQQVSAIREYAASQQDRLKKLQDGYDWNIIKGFCLRIIRCIDNLDNRIERLSENDSEVSDLEEVRDELIFALESSGVEQYEPELGSEYRGQEKLAEAVKDKMECDDPEKKGKIDKVIRPGYQCFIDDENVRIVRPAQVRLYA